MDLELSGKRALITGSTQGIGRAIADALLDEGVTLIVNGRDAGRVAETVDELSARGAVSGIAADLATAAGADAVIAEAGGDGPIDILINNVSYYEVRPFFEIDDDEWPAMFELNVMSGVRLARALLAGMLERDWGRIVFIGSDQSSKPNPLMAHYAMTKTAQVSVARSLAELTRGTGVTVNTVQAAPTWTGTVAAFMDQMAEREATTPAAMSTAYFAEGAGRTSLLQRWAEPAEIASLVAFLCSPRAAAINGAAPRADGGIVHSLF